jgi:hypothetical protein
LSLSLTKKGIFGTLEGYAFIYILLIYKAK